MRFFLWKCVAALAGASLIVICSCEKHHLGEFPEAQKEHVDLAKKPHDSNAALGSGSEGSPAKSPSPTPAEFFPEKKNP
jgi:hypothetical protein